MEKRSLKSKVLIGGALVVLTCTHYFFYISSFGESFELNLMDLLFRLRGARAAPAEVALISMDEASYQNLNVSYNQAWPRALHARLLEKLRGAGVKRVVFDVLFLGPTTTEVDSLLAGRLAEVPSVIGADVGEAESEHGSGVELLYPLGSFADKAREVALVGLPETFGVLRSFFLGTNPLSSESGDESILDTLRPVAFAASNLRPAEIGLTARDFINYYGPAGTIESYSYYQILEEEVPFPLERLKDKVVFVGLHLRSELGPDQKDSYLTPYAQRGRTFGVEIHATATANLLARSWITRLSERDELLLLSALLVSCALLMVSRSPLRAALSLGGVAVVWGLISIFAFSKNLFIPGLSVLSIFAPATYVVTTLGSYLSARKSQRRLEHAFSLYLSPQMAREFAKDPKGLALGGEKVIATALFTDIADFTRMSENMPAEEVTHMLNDYFTELVDIVFEEQGILVKFIGDSVFALWGMPIRLESHTDNAFRAALAMRDKLENSPLLKSYPKIVTRIGLHTGPMVVGNLGSRRRFDYTAIGDSVNLASRIEGLNKYLGTTILLSDAVQHALHTTTKLLNVGRVRVVGRVEPVTIYTTPQTSLSAEIEQRWQAALDAFAYRQWDQAEREFQHCQAHMSEFSQAASFYLEQLQSFRLQPPFSDWQGELILSSK